MRTTERVTVTVPKDLLARARDEVAAGRAPSLSAWITDAMAANVAGRDLGELVDEWLEASGGPLTQEERQWADRILARSSSTQER
jgi:post-segregation antitoxin (ccd killing protein)